MFKTILFLLFSVLVFGSEHMSSSYTIKYNHFHVGIIDNIDTINNGYLEAKAGGFAGLFTPFDKFVLFDNSQYSPKQTETKEKIKYRKDTHHLINLLCEVLKKRPHKTELHFKNTLVNVECKTQETCVFERNDFIKNTKDRGIIKFQKELLIEITDYTTGVSIVKN